MARSGKGRSSSRSKSFGLAGIGEKQKPNPAARKSQETSSRDSVDRQGRFSAPSPARLRERSDTRDPNFATNRQFYNRMTYSQTDVSDLRGAKTGLVRPNESGPPAAAYVDRPEYRGGAHPTNFGLRGQAVGNPGGRVAPTRQSVPETPKQSGYRRQRSTQEAYRTADASMFDSTVTPKAAPLPDTYRAADSGMMDAQPEASGNRTLYATSDQHRQASTESAYRAADASTINSNVTPKAAPLKDYKPRGKTIADKKTNIQAFY